MTTEVAIDRSRAAMLDFMRAGCFLFASMTIFFFLALVVEGWPASLAAAVFFAAILAGGAMQFRAWRRSRRARYRLTTAERWRYGGFTLLNVLAWVVMFGVASLLS